MAHRHSFYTDKKAQRPNRLLLDNGNLAENPGKLTALLRVMALDGYDAVGTGPVDRPMAEHLAREAARLKVRLVRALPQGDAVDRVAEPLYVKRLRGRDIGVTSLPPTPKSAEEDAYLDKAAAALRELRGKCQFLILLSQLGLENDKELAKRCGNQGPHVIIGNLDAEALRAPLHVAGCTLVPTGPGGIRVGTAEIAIPRWGDPQFEQAILSPAQSETSADPSVSDIVSGYYLDLQKLFLEGVDPRLTAKSTHEGAGDTLRCGRCHEKEARRWNGSGHARAVDTLLEHSRLVPECIVCHSTRFRDQGIFDHAARAGSVDCTSCHPAAASQGGSSCPEKASPTRGAETCIPCHTVANSPNFNYVQYLPRIDHTREPDPRPDEEEGDEHGHQPE